MQRQRAIQAGDDARRQRAFQTKRVAQREDAHAHFQPPRIGKLNRHKNLLGGVDPNHGDVVDLVGPDELGVIRFAVREQHIDLPRLLNDVVVRQNMPIEIEHASRTRPFGGQIEQEDRVGPNPFGGEVDDAFVDLLVDGDVHHLFGGQFFRVDFIRTGKAVEIGFVENRPGRNRRGGRDGTRGGPARLNLGLSLWEQRRPIGNDQNDRRAQHGGKETEDCRAHVGLFFDETVKGVGPTV